jgi:hypothetical protein
MKKKKRKSLVEAELSMKKFLERIGYTGNFKGQSVNEIPDYRIKSDLPSTSNVIPGKTPKKTPNIYTGNKIIGIAVTHKSNLVPISKNNKQAAIDIAQMRRS